jgi:hypothetical protein
MISFSDTCLCSLVEYLGSPQRIFASNSVPNRAEVVEHPPRPTRGLVLSYGAIMELGLHGNRKSATWKETVTSAILGYGNTNVICAPEPDPLIDIRLESGVIVEIIEGNDDVVTEVEGVPDGALRWS